MVGAWAKLLWNSAVVAAVAVAAQLGAGDALGILRWDTPNGTRDWSALLTWIVFCYAVAVFSGAMVGRLAVRRSDRRDRVGARITASLAAAGGAAAVIALAWLPAHKVHPPANVNPGLTVSIAAGAGVVVGLVIALLALSAAPVAAGLEASVAWLWLVAIGCAIAGLLTHQPYPSPRLGMLDAPSLIPATAWTGPRAMVGIAAVLGLVVAGIARWGGSGRFGVALAGFGGPAVVAAAYLVAGPGAGPDRTAQAEPYLAALIAVGAGLIASVLIAMPGRRADRLAPPALDLDDLNPLEGDLVAPPARPAWAGTSPYSSPSFGAAPAYAGGAAYAGSGSLASTGVLSGASQTDLTGASASGSGPGWDADTWPGTLGGSGARRSGRDAEPADARISPDWVGAVDRLGSGDGGTDWRATTQGKSADTDATSAGTYRGGTYASGAYETVTPSSASSTAGPPVMGQPGMAGMGQPEDPHESWLRELGSPGRHAMDDRRP